MAPRLGRRGLTRVLVFGGSALGVAGLVFWLGSLTPLPTAQVSVYDSLTISALDKLEALSEKGLTAAGAIIGALGAILLGFNKDVRLAEQQIAATGLTVFFCILSAISGVSLRFHLIEMLSNRMSPFLNDDVIQTPLLIQYVCLLLALAASGWLIIEGTFKNSG